MQSVVVLLSVLTLSAAFIDADMAPNPKRMGIAPLFELAHAQLPVAARIEQSSTPSLPPSFNVSAHWPECASIVNTISNQGDCGSCWAVSSAGVFSDRLCVATAGKVREEFSADDTMSCCEPNCAPTGNGCNGGYPSSAYTWFSKSGVVTGGMLKGCLPYPKPAVCDCTSKCGVDYNGGTYTKNKHFAATGVSIAAYDVEQMQSHIIRGGSIGVTYEIFEDFYHHYKSGVYVKKADSKSVGWHAVRVVGWGNDPESGLDFWLVANSWGTNWGMDGFFMIVRGRNECSIETYPATVAF